MNVEFTVLAIALYTHSIQFSSFIHSINISRVSNIVPGPDETTMNNTDEILCYWSSLLMEEIDTRQDKKVNMYMIKYILHGSL